MLPLAFVFLTVMIDRLCFGGGVLPLAFVLLTNVFSSLGEACTDATDATYNNVSLSGACGQTRRAEHISEHYQTKNNFSGITGGSSSSNQQDLALSVT